MSFIDYEDMKAELNIKKTDETNDEILDRLCGAILSIWDEKTKRTWASTEHTEYHSAEESCSQIQTKNYPITAITTIHDDPDWEWGDDSLVSSDDYSEGDGKAGIIHYNGYFYKSKGGLKIVYTAGYTDSNVPDWLKQILIRQVAHWYQQAKEMRWDLGSKAFPSGAGSTNYNTLKANLLPDFLDMIEEKMRRNI